MASSQIHIHCVNSSDEVDKTYLLSYPPSKQSQQKRFEIVMDVSHSVAGKKMIKLSQHGLDDVSRSHEYMYLFGKSSDESSSSNGISDHALFYLTFNTTDGRKGLDLVDDVKDIESIVLEYKIDCVDTELDQRIHHRQQEIIQL